MPNPKLLVLFVLCIFFGCRKYDEPRIQVDPEFVEEYSSQLISDEHFAFALNKLVNNTRTAFKIVQQAGGKKLLKEYMHLAGTSPSYNQLKAFYITNKIDTTRMLQLHAENLASVLFMLDKNPQFAEEKPALQSRVFSNIAAAMGRNDFSSKYRGTLLVAYMEGETALGSKSLSSSSDDPVEPEDPADPVDEDMSWNMVAKCAVETIGGAIAGSTGLFRDLYGVITGYNLGYSGIIRVATSAFKTFAGSNAAGMAIGFGVCLIAEAFWGDVEPITDTTIYPAIDSIQWEY